MQYQTHDEKALQPTNTQTTFPHILAEHQNPNRLQKLLEAGAKTNVADLRDGFAALIIPHRATLKLLCLLMETDADKDMVGHSGKTALKLAAKEGLAEIVLLLVKAGADKGFGNDEQTI